MNIVLLPGMDGTGRLFEPLLPHLNSRDIQVIPLPQDGEQDYQVVVDEIEAQLPDGDFVLVAESFSGPLGMLLARKALPQLKALVLVATFVSPPHRLLLALAQLLPLKAMLQWPLSKLAIRWLMLGRRAPEEDIAWFRQVVSCVPSPVLKERLKVMSRLSLPSFKLNIPTVYIRPAQDRLVLATKRDEFLGYCSDLQTVDIAGPHFILQASPKACAAVINTLLDP